MAAGTEEEGRSHHIDGPDALQFENPGEMVQLVVPHPLPSPHPSFHLLSHSFTSNFDPVTYFTMLLLQARVGVC